MATSGAPGSSTSIRVCGQATINAGAEPLYVVDGVIWNNSNSSGSSVGIGDALGNGSVSTVSPLSSLNPSDIVSMEVLKASLPSITTTCRRRVWSSRTTVSATPLSSVRKPTGRMPSSVFNVLYF